MSSGSNGTNQSSGSRLTPAAHRFRPEHVNPSTSIPRQQRPYPQHLVCSGKIFVVGEDKSPAIECNRPPMHRSPVPSHRAAVDDHVRVVLDHHTLHVTVPSAVGIVIRTR